jgi:hypothetical protein|tara:strand:+ start:410 stop:871 length:462 start_codon:yes stop_codon:yes gene_type:complete
MKKHISETEYCMWEVEFRLYKSYKNEIFSFKEAENDFNAKIGISWLEHDEEVIDGEFVLSGEFQYYACDSGHGGNIINDCLVAMREDGVDLSLFDDYDYEWSKIDLQSRPEYEENIQMSLSVSSLHDIKYHKPYFIGECLGIILDNCDCSNCN